MRTWTTGGLIEALQGSHSIERTLPERQEIVTAADVTADILLSLWQEPDMWFHSLSCPVAECVAALREFTANSRKCAEEGKAV